MTKQEKKQAAYPVWFFTNERSADILAAFADAARNKKIARLFSICGSGDFLFSVLSFFPELREVHACDIRPNAFRTLGLKKTLFAASSLREALTQLAGRSSELKKSGIWYKDSFWQLKQKQTYLPYLASDELYAQMKKSLGGFETHQGDFRSELAAFPLESFDLMYASNILDSDFYCGNQEASLHAIWEKLSPSGFLFLATQNNPKKMIAWLERDGMFRIFLKEEHRFSILSSILGHYDYSFLILKKTI